MYLTFGRLLASFATAALICCFVAFPVGLIPRF